MAGQGLGAAEADGLFEDLQTVQHPERGRLAALDDEGEGGAISAALAGIAGGLSAQITQFVSLSVFGLDMAGAVLIVLVVGGRGRLYGAFVGATAYMVVQDILAKDDPVFWLFWVGLILIAIVLFAPGGLLGLSERIAGWRRTKSAESIQGRPSAEIEYRSRQ